MKNPIFEWVKKGLLYILGFIVFITFAYVMILTVQSIADGLNTRGRYSHDELCTMNVGDTLYVEGYISSASLAVVIKNVPSHGVMHLRIKQPEWSASYWRNIILTYKQISTGRPFN